MRRNSAINVVKKVLWKHSVVNFSLFTAQKKKGLKVDTSMDIAVLVVKYVNTKSWNISEVTGFQTKRIGCISRQHNTVQYMVQ